MSWIKCGAFSLTDHYPEKTSPKNWTYCQKKWRTNGTWPCNQWNSKQAISVKVLKHVHDLILIQCVFICLHVNMGLTLSALRLRFYFYCLVARNIPSSDSASLTETFCKLPGSTLDKLKRLHSEVFTKVHWGRLLVFLNFVQQLRLTDEEWEQLFHFLVPTLNQIQE